MTSLDTHCTSTRAQEPPPATRSRKSVLFCPECGYESDTDTNWIVRTADEADHYVCPKCRTTVATR